MKKLKCTSCGGHLDVEENKEYAVCKHCGARYKLNEDININIKVNDREEYKLSDKKYKKIKKVLAIIGIASLCIGILLFIISFLVDVPAMGNPGWFDAESKKDMMRFLAFIFGIMIPLPVFSFAYGREIEAYNNK